MIFKVVHNKMVISRKYYVVILFFLFFPSTSHAMQIQIQRILPRPNNTKLQKLLAAHNYKSYKNDLEVSDSDTDEKEENKLKVDLVLPNKHLEVLEDNINDLTNILTRMKYSLDNTEFGNFLFYKLQARYLFKQLSYDRPKRKRVIFNYGLKKPFMDDCYQHYYKLAQEYGKLIAIFEKLNIKVNQKDLKLIETAAQKEVLRKCEINKNRREDEKKERAARQERERLAEIERQKERQEFLERRAIEQALYDAQAPERARLAQLAAEREAFQRAQAQEREHIRLENERIDERNQKIKNNIKNVVGFGLFVWLIHKIYYYDQKRSSPHENNESNL